MGIAIGGQCDLMLIFVIVHAGRDFHFALLITDKITATYLCCGRT